MTFLSAESLSLRRGSKLKCLFGLSRQKRIERFVRQSKTACWLTVYSLTTRITSCLSGGSSRSLSRPTNQGHVTIKPLFDSQGTSRRSMRRSSADNNNSWWRKTIFNWLWRAFIRSSMRWWPLRRSKCSLYTWRIVESWLEASSVKSDNLTRALCLARSSPKCSKSVKSISSLSPLSGLPSVSCRAKYCTWQKPTIMTKAFSKRR